MYSPRYYDCSSNMTPTRSAKSHGLMLLKKSRAARKRVEVESKQDEKSDTQTEVMPHEEASAMVHQLKMAENLESTSASLHDLVLSCDPKKHELAVSMIEQGAYADGFDIQINSVMDLAIKSGAVSVILALIDKESNFISNKKKLKKVMEMAMQSSVADKLMTCFFNRALHEIELFCDCLPWNMPNDHLLKLLVSFLKTADEIRGKSFTEWAAQNILECVMSKNLQLAKLLFSYRTDGNEKLINLQTVLSYNFVLSDPAMITFLVREGADINHYVNDKKQYPLHLVCQSLIQTEETIQLLLRLGADVNVCDRSGNTPLYWIFQKYDCEVYYCDVAKLMIKHFARLNRAGRKVNEKDLFAVQNQPKFKKFYEMCLEELDKMDTIEAADGFPYYWFFSETCHELALLIKNINTFEQLKKSLLPRKPELFPIFKADMVKKFSAAKHIASVIASREKNFEELFRGTLPSSAAHKIARYSIDFDDEYH